MKNPSDSAAVGRSHDTRIQLSVAPGVPRTLAIGAANADRRPNYLRKSIADGRSDRI